jgi:hypothetical protein
VILRLLSTIGKQLFYILLLIFRPLQKPVLRILLELPPQTVLVVHLFDGYRHREFARLWAYAEPSLLRWLESHIDALPLGFAIAVAVISHTYIKWFAKRLLVQTACDGCWIGLSALLVAIHPHSTELWLSSVFFLVLLIRHLTAHQRRRSAKVRANSKRRPVAATQVVSPTIPDAIRNASLEDAKDSGTAVSNDKCVIPSRETGDGPVSERPDWRE